MFRTSTVRCVCGFVVAMLGAVSGAAQGESPALVQPPSQERHPGKIVWLDLVTPDVPGAERFYGGLFGWTFQDLSTGDRAYALALADGVPVGGLAQRPIKPGHQRRAAWLTLLSVPDVDAAARLVVAQGGRVLAAPGTYAWRGRQAVFADPQGAVFAALQSSSGDPPDVMREPGEWIWGSLLTTDPHAAAAFYQAVFAYQVFDPASGDGVEHVLLASDHYARASANELPAGSTKARPHWLNFVRVTSAARAAAEVTALGGRVLVAPHSDRHGGLTAVAADPDGARFGLLEWSGEGSKGMPK